MEQTNEDFIDKTFALSNILPCDEINSDNFSEIPMTSETSQNSYISKKDLIKRRKSQIKYPSENSDSLSKIINGITKKEEIILPKCKRTQIILSKNSNSLENSENLENDLNKNIISKETDRTKYPFKISTKNQLRHLKHFNNPKNQNKSEKTKNNFPKKKFNSLPPFEHFCLNKKNSYKRDPNIPKRPLTPYLRFSIQYRPILTKKFPNLNFRDTASLASNMWKNLSKEEKKIFYEEYENDKKVFDQLSSEYYKSKERKEFLKERDQLKINESFMNESNMGLINEDYNEIPNKNESDFFISPSSTFSLKETKLLELKNTLKSELERNCNGNNEDNNLLINDKEKVLGESGNELIISEIEEENSHFDCVEIKGKKGLISLELEDFSFNELLKELYEKLSLLETEEMFSKLNKTIYWKFIKKGLGSGSNGFSIRKMFNIIKELKCMIERIL